MYTTKRVHPHTAESWISVNDPYNNKQPVRASFKGKQFEMEVSKAKPVGYFGKQDYVPDAFARSERVRYMNTQPREKRKKGFGSLDASRRGEFCLNTATQQYRELLKSEQRHNLKSFVPTLDLTPATQYLEGRPVANTDRTSDRLPYLFQRNVPTNLYDIGRDSDSSNDKGTVGITPICNKCSRDTFYCKHRANANFRFQRYGSTDNADAAFRGGLKLTPRNTGPCWVSAEQYGSLCTTAPATRPAYGRVAITGTFYDSVRGSDILGV